ncbi:MAG: ParA family protein [Nostoc indistinguendum CM1-VF10]|nr:ParA family protein [Nostoc indistinguendum CM1-VF10]
MQVRLALLSNAGGSGKTTLAVHLAYLLANEGFRVALIDLDPQGSVSLFCGLPRPKGSQTIDCPATLGPLPLIALSACTHLLIPVQVEPKSADGSRTPIQ